MRFITVITAVGLFSFLALGSPEPQTPQQSSDVQKQLEDYLEALVTDPAFNSVISAVATDTVALESVTKWQASITAAAKQSAVPSDYLNGLPTGLRSVFASVASAENSILTKNGFSNILPTATPTGTGANSAASTSSSKAGAAETGRPARMGAMAAAGAAGLGLLAVL